MHSDIFRYIFITLPVRFSGVQRDWASHGCRIGWFWEDLFIEEWLRCAATLEHDFGPFAEEIHGKEIQQ